MDSTTSSQTVGRLVAPAADVDGRINQTLSQQGQILESVEVAVKHLEERLQHVLAPYDVNVAGETADPKAVQSPIADHVESHNGRLDIVLEHLRSIAHRVDL